jgi:hypothetical protein
MVNSSCGTSAAGSDKPASDQGYSSRSAGDRTSLRVVANQPACVARCSAAGDRSRVPSHRAPAGYRRASGECPAGGRATGSSGSSSLPFVLPPPVRRCSCRGPCVLAHQSRHQPARVSVAAPNQPLEPTAGRSCLLDSKLSSARRGSSARRSARSECGRRS